MTFTNSAQTVLLHVYTPHVIIDIIQNTPKVNPIHSTQSNSTNDVGL
jgi:hypothetical protein